jgi:phosphate transport system protein
MRRLIDVGLEELSNIIVRMGELAYKSISLCLRSYIEDNDSYTQVQDLSDGVVLMQEQFEDKAFELIARYQPVASDLRILKSYMKIAYDFARYSRYAFDVAQVQKRLGGLEECEDWIREWIMKMSEKVLSMVRKSVDSLKSHDGLLARSLSDTENEVDDMYFMYLDKLVENAPALNKCTISSVLVVRYLERIADHATYIGESIIYLATGEKVSLR